MYALDLCGEFSFPNHIVFGPGRVSELADRVRPWGSQALVVTDEGIHGSGILDRVLEVLRDGNIDYRTFDGVEPNPSGDSVEAGVRRLEGCDFIISVGGGSVIDAGKAIRLRATHGGPLEQYDDLIGGSSLIRGDLPPMVAIPTTAGTGSEVGRSTVITLGGRKTVIFSPALIPTMALCDPALTLDMPRRVTAGTGADALTHNIEAYYARGFHPLCDAIAVDGMRRAMRSLPVAMEEPRDLAARSDMMVAAMMGAIAFQKGLGVVHSLSHPLSTIAGVHHGTANALMLPYALRFNREFIADRSAVVADALGVPAAPNPLETVERIATALENLFQAIGLPARLREVGVQSALICRMADLAMEDGCHLCNPRPVSRQDMVDLYEAAL